MVDVSLSKFSFSLEIFNFNISANFCGILSLKWQDHLFIFFRKGSPRDTTWTVIACLSTVLLSRKKNGVSWGKWSVKIAAQTSAQGCSSTLQDALYTHPSLSSRVEEKGIVKADSNKMKTSTVAKITLYFILLLLHLFSEMVLVFHCGFRESKTPDWVIRLS